MRRVDVADDSARGAVHESEQFVLIELLLCVILFDVVRIPERMATVTECFGDKSILLRRGFELHTHIRVPFIRLVETSAYLPSFSMPM